MKALAAEQFRARGGGKNLASPFNEGFSFDSLEQLAFIKRLHPGLDDPDPRVRRAAWVRFGQSSVGQAFRVR